jgi:hypothetical protein
MIALWRRGTALCKIVNIVSLCTVSPMHAPHNAFANLCSIRKATTSTNIVTSLFPKSIADRLMQEQEAKESKQSSFMSANRRVRSFLSGHEDKGEVGKEPIADLFPNASCFFADIAGFTAWSKPLDF